MRNEVEAVSISRHSPEIYEKLSSSMAKKGQILRLQQLYSDSTKIISIVIHNDDHSLFCNDDDDEQSPQNSSNLISCKQTNPSNHQQSQQNKNSLDNSLSSSQQQTKNIEPNHIMNYSDLTSSSIQTNTSNFTLSNTQTGSPLMKALSNNQEIFEILPRVVIKEVIRLPSMKEQEFKREGGNYSLLKNEFLIHQQIKKHKNILRVGSFWEHDNGACIQMQLAKYGDCDLFIQWQQANLKNFFSSYQYLQQLNYQISTASHPNQIEVLEDKQQDLLLHIKKEVVSNQIKNCMFAMRSIAKQIGEALYFLHEKCRVVHNDLKPDNFYISKNKSKRSNYVFKLADFGYSRKIYFENNQEAYKFFQRKSTRYLAPELIKLLSNENASHSLPLIDCRKCDIYSFGLSLFQIIAGGFPYNDNIGDANCKKFFEEKLSVQEILQPLKICLMEVTPYEDLIDLLTHMLDPVPKTRYNIEQVLIHPYLRNFKQKTLFRKQQTNISFNKPPTGSQTIINNF